MNEELDSIPKIYAKGLEKLAEVGYHAGEWSAPETDPTARANRQYMDSLYFKTRFLNPVPVDIGLTLFGVKLKTPVFCSALSGFNQLFLNKVSPTSLVDVATGIKNAGSLFMLGRSTIREMKTALGTGVPVIKIIKPYRKSKLIYERLRYAEDNGCVAVGMDIDRFYGARRVGDRVDSTGSLYAPQTNEMMQELISSTKLPFIIKGILTIEDAEEAVRLGASAIVVSGHGLSSIAYAVPPMMMLPDIVKAVGDRVTILIDSGFRTGTDALKALALGAKAVGFTSSIEVALGADGADGVTNLINQITAEIRRTMAATGCSSLSTINDSMVINLAQSPDRLKSPNKY